LDEVLLDQIGSPFLYSAWRMFCHAHDLRPFQGW
jgi:hypothetical protein